MCALSFGLDKSSAINGNNLIGWVEHAYNGTSLLPSLSIGQFLWLWDLMAVAFMVVTGYANCDAVEICFDWHIFLRHILIFIFDISETSGYSMRKLLV